MKIAEMNRERGREFLARNRERPGVCETQSGLQYEIRAPGAEKPGPEDMVTVHYRGTLIDGTEFDSSYARGAPATFSLQSVIAGWREGLQLVGQGGKLRLFVPADLAYGDRSPSTKIRPGATLIFDVELLAIDKN